MTCAQRALSLDDNDAFCHCQLGFVLIYFERFDEAESHINRAVLLNENNVFFAMHQANLLMRIGRAQEALDILELVVIRDPLMPPVYWELRAGALFHLRRYAEAIKAMLQMNPSSIGIRPTLQLLTSIWANGRKHWRRPRRPFA